MAISSALGRAGAGRGEQVMVGRRAFWHIKCTAGKTAFLLTASGRGGAGWVRAWWGVVVRGGAVGQGGVFWHEILHRATVTNLPYLVQLSDKVNQEKTLPIDS